MEAVPLWSARPLSVLLGRERQVLERIGWQLRVALVLLESDRLAWAGPAFREADLLVDRLDMLELSRAVELAGAGPALGLGSEPTLDELVARWPAPGRPVLRRHALHLRRLVAAATERAQAVLDALDDEPTDEPPLEALVRRGGLIVAGRVPPPSVTEFVGVPSARR